MAGGDCPGRLIYTIPTWIRWAGRWGRTISGRTRSPARRIATFDHMRQHYVSFSRAERLLVLTAGGPVHQRFDHIWDQARRWRELCERDIEALARQRFEPRAKAPAREAAPMAGRMMLRLMGVDVRVGRAPC